MLWKSSDKNLKGFWDLLQKVDKIFTKQIRVKTNILVLRLSIPRNTLILSEINRLIINQSSNWEPCMHFVHVLFNG